MSSRQEAYYSTVWFNMFLGNTNLDLPTLAVRRAAVGVTCVVVVVVVLGVAVLFGVALLGGI